MLVLCGIWNIFKNCPWRGVTWRVLKWRLHIHSDKAVNICYILLRASLLASNRPQTLRKPTHIETKYSFRFVLQYKVRSPVACLITTRNSYCFEYDDPPDEISGCGSVICFPHTMKFTMYNKNIFETKVRSSGTTLLKASCISLSLYATSQKFGHILLI